MYGESLGQLITELSRLPGIGRKTAERLSFRAGAREVRILGNAAVEAKGWPREVRFRELLFTLTADGIDLKRASEIEVR